MTLLRGFRDAWRLPADLEQGDRNTVSSILLNALAKAIARGSFVALSVIYLSQGLRLDATQVSLAVFVSGALGLAGSLLGGFIADRWSSKVLTVFASVGLVIAYAAVSARSDLWAAIIAFGAVAVFDRGAAAILGTWIGQRLPVGVATRSRALVRAVGNLGIAIGAALVALVLVQPAPIPYEMLFLIMAGVECVGVLFLLGAPRTQSVARTVGKNRGALGVFVDHGFTVFVVGIAAFSTLYLILDFLLPLWVSTASGHDYLLVPIAIIINTTLVVLFQVPVSAFSDTPARAARAIGVSGGILLGAAALFALSAITSSVVGVAFFCLAVVVLTLAEILTSAAGWTLSYAYAPEGRIGAYQGVFGFGTSLGVMVAPIVLTSIVIHPTAEGSAWGWLILGGSYTAIGSALWLILRGHFRIRQVAAADGRRP